ncbi:MAG: NUDIX domain-containing protein [Phycisphaeraceae bacterium]|nr:MAG: NUDIX domain-containing protein [Phycisphaeraceae bacterium]
MTQDHDGYRTNPRGGPSVRTDIVDAYIFRRPRDASTARVIELLQLRRARAPLADTWQPIMGHIEKNETAHQTILREIGEEVGLQPTDPAFLGAWALEQVHPFYLAALDCIVMSPRFAIEVAHDWEPRLNAEHTAHRWIGAPLHAGLSALEFFLWPGQRGAVEELLSSIVPRDAPARAHLKLPDIP